MTTPWADWESLMNDRFPEPFDPEQIGWKASDRPDEIDFERSRVVAYPVVDPRHYYRRLNAAAGAGWQDHYTVQHLGGQITVVCALTIGDVTRTGDGAAMASGPNAITIASAQAFKRACVKFGIGAYLYSFPTTWADAELLRRADREGGFRWARWTEGGIIALQNAAEEATAKARYDLMMASSARYIDQAPQGREPGQGESQPAPTKLSEDDIPF